MRMYHAALQQDQFRKNTTVDTAVLASVVLAVASLLFRTYNDADTWWHVTIGKEILTTLSVPRFDHFTAAGWGRPYHDSHWLFQAVLAAADRLGGTVAVGLIPSVCWSVTFIYSYRSIRAWLDSTVSCLLLFVLAVACNARFIPRPDMVTCLMIAVYYYKLQAGYYKTYPQLLFFGVMQIIWSNSHGLFVVGPFMAFCYMAGSFQKGASGYNFSDVLPAARLLAVLLIASFCAPFGFDGWRYAVQIAQEASLTAHPLFRDLNEMKSVFSLHALSHPDYWAFYILLAAGFCLTIPLLVAKKSSKSRIALVLGLFVVACSGRRNMPLFALAMAPFVAEAASKLVPEIGLNKTTKIFAAIVLVGFVSLPVSGAYYRYFDYHPIRFGLGAPPEYQPAQFPDFVRKIDFKGQIYNNDVFGGYLMYQGVVPLFDGRWEIYDLEELTIILAAPFDPLSWRWVENRYAIGGALLRLGEPATQALVARFIEDGSYQMVYYDDVSSFWIRSK